MGWEERLKEVLGLPAEARSLSVYPYTVPKGERVYTYLRCEYTLGEKRRTKHIPTMLTRVVEKILEQRDREEVASILDNIYYFIQKLKAYSLEDSHKEQLRNILNEAMKLLEDRDGVQ